MVFYIIAAVPQGSQKNKGKAQQTKEGANALNAQVASNIQSTKSFQQGNNKSELHQFKVDKDQFKVGSLDQLMQVNEHAAKMDQQLDMACKKYEKICFDNCGAVAIDKLMMTDENDSTKKFEYKDYVSRFEWNQRKYNQKLPLMELCKAFMKTQEDQDKHAKKFMDDLAMKRNKQAMLAKKEGQTLNVKDYTDDIYNNQALTVNNFIEGKKQKFGAFSEEFCNMLCVVPKAKQAGFSEECKIVMRDHYRALDEAEDARTADNAMMRLNEALDTIVNAHDWMTWCETNGIRQKPADVDMKQPEEVKKDAGDAYAKYLKDKQMYDAKVKKNKEDMEEWTKLAKAGLHKVITAEIAKRRSMRMPHCIVPDAPMPLGIVDKEGNAVFRIIVYKSQAEDVIKALRRKGYTPRHFTYNKAAWEAENAERKLLKEQVDNATTALYNAAVTCYQTLFIALMHLKVVRAYIDGVLRFGIPPCFYIGIVMPKKGYEKAILNDMNNVLADESLKEMYGEKQDAQDNEDYWPFVCVHLTSPNFMHTKNE